MTGKIVCPGFIDAHIHLRVLCTPTEFVRAITPSRHDHHVTDPHEDCNVMGTDGIECISQATEGARCALYAPAHAFLQLRLTSQVQCSITER